MGGRAMSKEQETGQFWTTFDRMASGQGRLSADPAGVRYKASGMGRERNRNKYKAVKETGEARLDESWQRATSRVDHGEVEKEVEAPGQAEEERRPCGVF